MLTRKTDVGGSRNPKVRLIVLAFATQISQNSEPEPPCIPSNAASAFRSDHAGPAETAKAGAVTAFLQGDQTKEERQVFAAPLPETKEAFRLKEDQVLPGFGFTCAVEVVGEGVPHLVEVRLEAVQSKPCLWRFVGSGRWTGVRSYPPWGGFAGCGQP